jgi:hypothetical protein
MTVFAVVSTTSAGFGGSFEGTEILKMPGVCRFSFALTALEAVSVLGEEVVGFLFAAESGVAFTEVAGLAANDVKTVLALLLSSAGKSSG